MDSLDFFHTERNRDKITLLRNVYGRVPAWLGLEKFSVLLLLLDELLVSYYHGYMKYVDFQDSIYFWNRVIELMFAKK